MGKGIKIQDRVGTTVNGLYIERAERVNGRSMVYIRCPYCGNKKWVRFDGVKCGDVKSCGCYNIEHNYRKPIDISNKTFGRLTAIEPTEERGENGSVIWLCKCECGKYTHVSYTSLTLLRVRSCGCLGTESSQRSGKIAGQCTVDRFCVDGTHARNLTAKIPKHNTSGIKGVHWDRSRQKWVAQIEFKGKCYYLGRYTKKEDAAEMRKIAEDKLFGDFLEWFKAEFPERRKFFEKESGDV